MSTLHTAHRLLFGIALLLNMASTMHARADVPEYDIKIPGSKELRIPYSGQNFRLNFTIDNPSSRRYYHVFIDRDRDAEKYIKVIGTQQEDGIYEKSPNYVLRFHRTFWIEYQRIAPSYKDIKFKVRYLQEEHPDKDGQFEIFLEKRPPIYLGDIDKYLEIVSQNIYFNERATSNREAKTECLIKWKGSEELSDQSVLCKISLADNEKYFSLQCEDKKSDENDLLLRFNANAEQ